MNQKIKFLRNLFGLSEKEISSLLNISTYKYTFYENTLTDVPCDIIILISVIYGVDIQLLIYNKFSNEDLLSALKAKAIKLKTDGNVYAILRQNLINHNGSNSIYLSIRKCKQRYQNNISAAIKELAKENQMSMYELSEYVDMDNGTLHSLIDNKRFIKVDELIRISEKFNIPINNIITH